MDRLAARKLRYYAGLHYPSFVTLTAAGFCGRHPDLPGCTVTADNPTAVYAALDGARRDHIARLVQGGADVPLPNSHLPLAPVVEDAVQVLPLSARFMAAEASA
ncbi:MAG: hypothetical protein HY903_06140 [Deltaproteobacteria bacterium]|nr:hypothetical protein [Deltaproteobacteria bacterium]